MKDKENIDLVVTKAEILHGVREGFIDVEGYSKNDKKKEIRVTINKTQNYLVSVGDLRIKGNKRLDYSIRTTNGICFMEPLVANPLIFLIKLSFIPPCMSLLEVQLLPFPPFFCYIFLRL